MDQETFQTLLQQVRAGDAEAATQLVREYEPAIRRYVRLHLTDPRLRRVVDTMDVCQSVLANFFVRAASGQFDLERPEQLFNLLATMARNRLLSHVQHERAKCRDHRRLAPAADEVLDAVAGVVQSPSAIVAGRELLQVVHERLSPEERSLAEQRAQGHDWAEIAAAQGGSPEALRKRLARAMDRVTRELGLGEPPDG